MIIEKINLDMVPAIFYSGIFSIIYGLILSDSFVFSSHDILMGFFLGVPQLLLDLSALLSDQERLLQPQSVF